MATLNHILIKEGDWVSGTTSIDEKFIGYVHSKDRGGLKVWVTQSDHADILGLLVESRLAKVKKLPEFTPEKKEDLDILIEIALMTNDKEWFDMLSAVLKRAGMAAGGQAAGPIDKRMNNRMRFGIGSE